MTSKTVGITSQKCWHVFVCIGSKKVDVDEKLSVTYTNDAPNAFHIVLSLFISLENNIWKQIYTSNSWTMVLLNFAKCFSPYNYIFILSRDNQNNNNNNNKQKWNELRIDFVIVAKKKNPKMFFFLSIFFYFRANCSAFTKKHQNVSILSENLLQW